MKLKFSDDEMKSFLKEIGYSFETKEKSFKKYGYQDQSYHETHLITEIYFHKEKIKLPDDIYENGEELETVFKKELLLRLSKVKL